MILFVKKVHEDDPQYEDALRLLYDTGLYRSSFEFKNRDEAAAGLSKMKMVKDTEFYYDNFWVCMDSDKVVGAMQAYDPHNIDAKLSVSAYRKKVGEPGFLKGYRVWRESSALYASQEVCFYIYSVGVADGYDFKDTTMLMISELLTELNKRHYETVYADIRQSRGGILEAIKKMGFEPVRAIENYGFHDRCTRFCLRLRPRQ
jgi:hypothetical protein